MPAAALSVTASHANHEPVKSAYALKKGYQRITLNDVQTWKTENLQRDAVVFNFELFKFKQWHFIAEILRSSKVKNLICAQILMLVLKFYHNNALNLTF